VFANLAVVEKKEVVRSAKLDNQVWNIAAATYHRCKLISQILGYYSTSFVNILHDSSVSQINCHASF
jgi:hypothetical protein